MANLYDEICYPKFPKTEIGRKALFWYNILWNKAVSLFEYENLPETINRDYLETILMARGSLIWIKDKQGNLRALYGAHYGFDCYNFPTTAEIANPVLGNLKGTFHINCVWMRNNMYALPIQDILFEYSMQLAQLDTNLKVNLDNLKTSIVFKAESPEQAKKIYEIYKDIISGKPAVVTMDDTNFINQNDFNIFSSNIEYLGAQFLADRRTIINDFLAVFGINTLSMEKKERLITGEIDSNNQELEINKNYWLKPRQEAVDEINKLFGTNISVKMVEPEKEDIEMKESDMNVDE